MNTAVIYYQSRTGTTEKLGAEIKTTLKKLNVETIASSIKQKNPEDVKKSELVCLGCWTGGLFLFGQHPDNVWIEHVAALPDLSQKKVILFTTYKIATGSMFKKMKKHLKGNPQNILTIQSKNGLLTDAQKKMIAEFI